MYPEKYKFSKWYDCQIDISVDDQLSDEVDLEDSYTHLVVLIPTITSAGISVRVSDEKGGTFYPFYDFGDKDGDTDILQITAAETTSKAIVLKIGGARHIKLYASNAQTSTDKDFKVRGVNL